MQSELRHAAIIIDDPLLRENYGFLNYRKLLNLMDKHNFSTTIAFIPFNFKRTDKKIAALFKERPDKLSICVHGCDHGKGEFGKTDLGYLDKKVKLATARMIEHEKRTGIAFDRIMIFPQGIFSNGALETLESNSYLAAVNTEAVSVDGHISSSFPLFKRYRPEDVRDWVPEPAFIVIHHDYFKDGYDKLGDFVDELNTRFKTLKWDNLGNIVRFYVAANTLNYNPADVDLSGFKLNGFKENLKIIIRRYASEFRDNYLCKNRFSLNWIKRLQKLIDN
jgi:hypothetical protein